MKTNYLVTKGSTPTLTPKMSCTCIIKLTNM